MTSVLRAVSVRFSPKEAVITPKKYAKAKAVADDERADPGTRAAAQRIVNKWKLMMEPQTPPEKRLHPGRVQSADYQAWAKSMAVGNRDRKP